MTAARSMIVDEDDLPRLTQSPPNNVPFWGLCGPDVPIPAEVPPPVSVESDRFVKRIERLSRDEDGLSKVARKAIEVLRRFHPDAPTEDLQEAALLLETSAGNTDQLMRALANPERLPTDHGDLVVVDYLVLSPMLSRDLANPRAFLQLGTRSNGSSGYSYTPTILDEYDRDGFRTIEVKDVAHYTDLHDAHRQALGFNGQVRDHRDRLDLERGVRLGILKPATAAMTRIIDRSTGRSTMQITLSDANRRFTLTERVHDVVIPQLNFGKFSRRHLYDGDGLTFRPFGPLDADEARSLLADHFADLDAPGASGDEDTDARRLHQWAKAIDDNDPMGAALLRLRAMRCRVVIGLDPASALADRNPMSVALGAYRDQLHLPELSDVEWDTRATEAGVAHDLLRKSRDSDSAVPPMARLAQSAATCWQDIILFDPTEVDWHVPGIASTHRLSVASELLGVDPNEVALIEEDVAALTPGLDPAMRVTPTTSAPPNVLDLVLATIATIVCRAQPMMPVISRTLAHHRMKMSPKARGQLAAAVLGPLLGLPAEGSDTARAYAALSRTAQHGVVYKLDESEDPLGDGKRWVDLIGSDWFDVLDRARRELKANDASGGVQTFGPAQTLLALAAAVCMETSPAVIYGDRGPSPFQLTLSGLGGQRGVYKGDPFAVLLALATSGDGLAQLWELIVAAVGDPQPRVARSIRWDVGAADGRIYGPYLTEVDVRDKPWGHRPPGGSSSGTGDTSAPPVRPGAAAFVKSIFDRVAEDLGSHAAELEPIIDRDNRTAVDPALDSAVDDYNGSPAEAYFSDGVDPVLADRILKAAELINRATMQGKVIRETTTARP